MTIGERSVALLYDSALLALAPVLGPLLALRARLQGKSIAELPLRLGLRRPQLPPSHGRIWLHAVSVGEVMAATRLFQGLPPAIRDRVVLSATTATGLALARKGGRPPPARVFASPVDLGPSVRRHVSAVRPASLILVEAELWPCWLRTVQEMGASTALVNARITERSARGYRRFRMLFGPIVRNLGLAAARTDADAARLAEIGVPSERLFVTGDVKFDIDPPALDRAGARAAFQLPRDGLIVVAGSVHPGEDAAVVSAFERLRARDRDATLVLAPRKSFEPLPLQVPLIRRTEDRPTPPGGVLFLDTIGELSAVYAAADIAFVGGSLVPVGGHNLLEPAAAGVPVLFGPHTFSHDLPARRLCERGGGVRVDSELALAEELQRLSSDRGARRAMGERGRDVVREGRGATQRTLQLLAPLLGS